MPIAGAVLCGGGSRRMGRDKALIEIAGVAMAERVARILERGGCSPVRFVGGDAAALGPYGRTVVPDAWPGQGPLGGVVTALRSGAGGVLVAACDLVDLDAGTVAVVLGDGEGDQPRVACSDRLEPALAYWPSVATGALERCFDAGVRALHEALDTIGYVAVPVAVEAMRNVNRPADVPPS